MFRPFICAIQFLTVLPIPGNWVKDEKELARSMAFYPAVGLLIGLLSVWCYRLGTNFFTPAISLILTYIAAIVLTGGLHLDGFADMCDGFYAGKDKPEILAIMKDPHIGIMAVIGLFCLLLLKLSLFFSLLTKLRLTESFLLVPAISRWVMTMAASFYPYARNEGTARPFIENIGWKEAVSSSLLMAGLSYYVLGLKGIIVSVLVLAAAFIFMQWVKKKIGGVTGDILGGLNEISEVSALFLLQCSFTGAGLRWNS